MVHFTTESLQIKVPIMDGDYLQHNAKQQAAEHITFYFQESFDSLENLLSLYKKLDNLQHGVILEIRLGRSPSGVPIGYPCPEVAALHTLSFFCENVWAAFAAGSSKVNCRLVVKNDSAPIV